MTTANYDALLGRLANFTRPPPPASKVPFGATGLRYSDQNKRDAATAANWNITGDIKV